LKILSESTHDICLFPIQHTKFRTRIEFATALSPRILDRACTMNSSSFIRVLSKFVADKDEQRAQNTRGTLLGGTRPLHCHTLALQIAFVYALASPAASRTKWNLLQRSPQAFQAFCPNHCLNSHSSLRRFNRSCAVQPRTSTTSPCNAQAQHWH
jgi:hypothetical protein